jgi:hypothetical protein
VEWAKVLAAIFNHTIGTASREERVSSSSIADQNSKIVKDFVVT